VCSTLLNSCPVPQWISKRGRGLGMLAVATRFVYQHAATRHPRTHLLCLPGIIPVLHSVTGDGHDSWGRHEVNSVPWCDKPCESRPLVIRLGTRLPLLSCRRTAHTASLSTPLHSAISPLQSAGLIISRMCDRAGSPGGVRGTLALMSVSCSR
jgi:hypothetical protein